MDYEPHPLCLAFPKLDAEEFKTLVDDIKCNGLRHEIVLYEGKILDGRHRYMACIEANVKPRFKEFSEGNPSDLVVSENIRRRHMTTSQRALAVTAIYEVEAKLAAERKREGQREGGRGKKKEKTSPSFEGEVFQQGEVATILAIKANVSRSTMQRAITIHQHGSAELKDAVASGKVSATSGEKIAKLNSTAAQRRCIDAPSKTLGDELRKATNMSAAARARGLKKPKPEISTPFVRKFLSGVERVAMVCAEDGCSDGPEIAAKFLADMDWESAPLRMQLDRCEPVLRALILINESRIRGQKVA